MEVASATKKHSGRLGLVAALLAAQYMVMNAKCPFNMRASNITNVLGIAKNPMTVMVGALLKKMTMEMG